MSFRMNVILGFMDTVGPCTDVGISVRSDSVADPRTETDGGSMKTAITNANQPVVRKDDAIDDMVAPDDAALDDSEADKALTLAMEMFFDDLLDHDREALLAIDLDAAVQPGPVVDGVDLDRTNVTPVAVPGRNCASSTPENSGSADSETSQQNRQPLKFTAIEWAIAGLMATLEMLATFGPPRSVTYLHGLWTSANGLLTIPMRHLS